MAYPLPNPLPGRYDTMPAPLPAPLPTLGGGEAGPVPMPNPLPVSHDLMPEQQEPPWQRILRIATPSALAFLAGLKGGPEGAGGLFQGYTRGRELAAESARRDRQVQIDEEAQRTRELMAQRQLDAIRAAARQHEADTEWNKQKFALETISTLVRNADKFAQMPPEQAARVLDGVRQNFAAWGPQYASMAEPLESLIPDRQMYRANVVAEKGLEQFNKEADERGWDAAVARTTYNLGAGIVVTGREIMDTLGLKPPPPKPPESVSGIKVQYTDEQGNEVWEIIDPKKSIGRRGKVYKDAPKSQYVPDPLGVGILEITPGATPGSAKARRVPVEGGLNVGEGGQSTQPKTKPGTAEDFLRRRGIGG